MAPEALIKAVDQQEALDRLSDQVQPLVRDVFKSAGPAGREVKNFLHGTWLGHPLHPALTDVPLGAWTAALALDAMESISGRRELAAGADGSVVDGPATFPQPCFEARVREGQIEVRPVDR